MIALPPPAVCPQQSEECAGSSYHQTGHSSLYVADIDDIVANLARQRPKEEISAPQRTRAPGDWQRTKAPAEWLGIRPVGCDIKADRPVKGVMGTVTPPRPKHRKSAQACKLLTRCGSQPGSKGRQESKSKHSAKAGLQEGSQSGAQGEKVMLNVYDVSRSRLVGAFNQAALPLIDCGLFHVAIEVWQHEFAFGYREDDTGVFRIEPQTDSMHRYRCSVDLGVTHFSEAECVDIVERLAALDYWHGSCYNGINRNCTHFARALAAEFGVAEFPDWVDSFCRAAQGWVTPVDERFQDLGFRCNFSCTQSQSSSLRSPCSSSSDDTATRSTP